MAEHSEPSSGESADEFAGEETPPLVSVVPLSKLQENDEQQSSASEPIPIASTSANTTQIRLDFTTPKKLGTTPKRKATTATKPTKAAGTPKKAAGTPKKATGTPKKGTGTPKKPDTPVKTPAPGSSKTPGGRRRKSFAERSGMPPGAILRYLVTKKEPTAALSVLKDNSRNTEMAEDEVVASFSSKTTNLDEALESISSTDSILATTTETESERDAPATLTFSDISEDDENTNIGRLEAPLVLQPATDIFSTPAKANASPSFEVTVLLSKCAEPSPGASSPTEEQHSVSASPAPNITRRLSATHVRNLNFDNQSQLSEPVKPVAAVVQNGQLRNLTNDNSPATDGDVAMDIAPPTCANELAAETGQIPIEASDNQPNEPAPRRRPLVPPRQKNAEEVYRRIAAHKRRMEEEGPSLTEVGVFFDDESSTSGPENNSPNPKIRSLGHSGIREHAKVKVPRRRRRRKFTQVKGQSRRASLESVASNSSTAEPGPSTGRKRNNSSSGSVGNEEVAKLNKKLRRDPDWTKVVTEAGKITPNELATMIDRCFLKRKVSATATRQEQNSALERFKAVICEYNDIQVFLCALELVNKDGQEGRGAHNCYWTVISSLFETAFKETQCRVSTKDESTINFLDLLCDLMVKSEIEHSKQKVKLSFSLLASVFQGPDPEMAPRDVWVANVKENFNSILGFAFLLSKEPSTSTEFKTCMKWLNCISRRYYGFASRVRSFMDEVDMVAIFLEQRKASNSTGINCDIDILKRIRVPKYVRSICEDIILGIIELPQFEKLLLDERGKQTRARKTNPDEFLRELAQSILVLSRILVDEMPTPKKSSGSVNKKGETTLHTACMESVEALEIEINQLLENPLDTTRNVNAKDFAGNTCFHDSAFHGKLESIEYLGETCYRPDEKPGPTNMDLFSKNVEGNTPMHLAVMQAEKEANERARDLEETQLDTTFPIVSELIAMVSRGSRADKNLAVMFNLKNNKGKTILDVVPKANTYFGPRLFFFLKNHQIDRPDTFAGIKLDPNHIEEIRSSSYLQDVIACWEHFDIESRKAGADDIV